MSASKGPPLPALSSKGGEGGAGEALELAVAAGCRYIVTHNLQDFRGTEKWGIAAVTPSGFLELIERVV